MRRELPLGSAWIVLGIALAAALAWQCETYAEDAAPAAADKAQQTGDVADGDVAEMVSLTQAAPQLLPMLRQYPDYFGSPWHRQGSLFERSSLSGDWGGLRKNMVDKGIFFDMSLTQVYQGNLAGGRSTDEGMRYNGMLDYWLSIDTAKAGLWSGGLIMVHGVTAFGDAANRQAGSLLPINYTSLFPSPAGGPRDTGLPEVYVMQALSEELTLVVGKFNLMGLGEQNAFANNMRTQFLNTGLNNNPLLFGFAPYTPLAVAAVIRPAPEHSITLAIADREGRANSAGWDTAFDRAVTCIAEWDIMARLGGQRGTYRFGALYTDQIVNQFATDRRTLIGQLVGLVPPRTEGSNHMAFFNFDQYLVTLDEEHDRGWGIFGRFGIAPEDRNAISQFYSFGVGGKGVIEGRPEDRFGIGWYCAHISDDLQSGLGAVGLRAQNEHGIELFYNIEITPSIHLTPDLQVIINPTATNGNVNSDDHAVVFGLRLQMDF